MPTPARVLTHESGLLALDLYRRELRLRGVSVPIGGRAFEILAILAQSAGELVGKDEVMERVWPGAIVEENTLAAHISAIRKALGPHRDLLRTVSGRGYRLVGDWAQVADAEAPPPAPPSPEPVSAPKPASRTNLPVSQIDLVGRAFAARHVADVLTAHRLVTLSGPGGIGKTALALNVARSVSASQRVDAYLADLAPLSDPRLAPSTIAAVLDVRLGSEAAVAASVGRAVGDRRLLLVIDNCEHLIDAAADMAETLIGMCPGVTILATSRENLRIEGEYVYRVGPLSVPTEQDQEPDAILAQSAVQLFLARMNASQSGFSPDPSELLQIAAVCRRLDGIPLAIEFAAARAATLGLAQVTARLDDRFGFLTAGRRTALPRHQTLRATLDWSYELLPESERRLLCRAAIFPAGFTLEAAAAVASGPEYSMTLVLDGIANLVAKSLLYLDGAPSAGRWRLLETIRAYALEKLAAAGETDQVARLCAEYFRDLFAPENAGRRGRQTKPRDATSDRREIDNVRAAIDWALSPRGDTRIGLWLTAYSAGLWFQLSLMAEYRQRVGTALERLRDQSTPEDELEMRLQVGLGYALWYSGPDGDPPAMKRAFERAVELGEGVRDAEMRLRALWGIWAVGRGSGDHASALAAATRYQAIADDAGHKGSMILAARILAMTHHDLGDQTRALHYVETVLEQAPHLDPETNNDLQVDARIAMLTLLARIQWLRGFPDSADRTAREALDAALRMDHWFSVCYVLFIAGNPVSLWNGDLAEARLRLEMLRERTGGNPGYNRFAGVFAAVVELRQGSELDALTAAYIEARTQYSTVGAVAKMTQRAPVPAPYPDDIPCDTPWCLPEVLRVDAELLLWRDERGAVAMAETKLRRSLEIARQQAALSWELRTAMSLARLRIKQNRRGEALELLEPVYGKFTEGFATADLRSARALIDSLR